MGVPARSSFQSTHFRNATGEAQRQLQGALTVGPLHIMPDRLLRPGEQQKKAGLKVVQEALNKLKDTSALLDLVAVPKGEIDGGNYGPGTEAAISAFKRKVNVLGAGQSQVDPITGVLTLSNLDEEMRRLEGQPKPDDAPKGETIDIVVDILGFGSPGDQGTQLGGQGLRQSLMSEKYKGKNRKLVVIQFKGSGDSRNPVGKIVALVDATLAGNTAGSVFLRGESAGGPNILQVADALMQRFLDIRYCGLADGAFQDGNTVLPPPPKIFPMTIPTIRSPLFTGQKVNIFQSFGNGRTFSTQKARMVWIGGMESGEIHGNVQGFQNRDLTAENLVTGPDATAAHTKAATDALPIHADNIRVLLDGLPVVAKT